MEPKTKKGLIIGGSVLGVVLIGTSLGLGLYFGLRSKPVNALDPVQSWGYDDQVSSTAAKVNWYMGTDTQVVTGTYGGVAVSSEQILLENSLYHSVIDDIDILDGVAGSKNGLGYLSSAWVGGYEDEDLKMLNLKSNITGEYLNPLNSDDKVEYSELLPNNDVESEKTDRTYTENDSVGIEWIEVSEVEGNLADGYVIPSGTKKVTGSKNDEGKFVIDALTDASDIINTTSDKGATWEPLTKGDYEKEMQATLNIHLKMPKVVVEQILADGIIKDTPTEMSAPNEQTKQYFDDIEELTYLDDFVLSLAFFDYISYDASNIADVNSSVIPGTTESGADEFTAADWAVYEKTYTNLGGKGKLTDVIKQQEIDNSGTYSIKIDGTGTNSGIMKTEVSNFEHDFTEFAGTEVNFKYDLNNGGSGEGWKGTDGSDKIDGVPSKPGNDGRADAFLGTQSRFSKDTEPTGGWGYETGDNVANKDESTGRYKTPDTATSGVVGYTMGIDLPVFFVQEDMEIEYTVTAEGAKNLNLADGTTPDVKEGDTITVKPVGIDATSAREIFQNGASWSEEISSGGVQIEIL